MALELKIVTAAELPSWEPAGTIVAFLGTEAALFAAIHSAALASQAATKPELRDWQMVAIDCTEAQLAEVMKTLHKKRVWGLVFTRPFKTAALKLLSPSFTNDSELTSLGLGTAEANTERIGAANLAMWRPNGYWGLSTEGAAFALALQDAFGLKLKGETLIVLGSGAFGRAASVEALAQGCNELWLGSRMQERAWDALDQIVPSPNMRARVHSFSLAKPSPKLPKKGIIVNAIPLEFRQAPEATFDISRFTDSTVYIDAAVSSSPVYEAAKRQDLPSALGIRMIAYEVGLNLQQIAGVSPDLDTVLWAVSEASKNLGA